ncbi:hypothetical protein AZ78_2744 [Lysobacter capsici AZ78]|uniref:Uncharacterized protein n=1 Tax=Lysobacter capsici AZ78 TaxID=1444315 RepID=A0A125MN22_9GAMM|nr:hypothetical protein AZ78_2744 [Lysobacter capsici AZ78]
MGELGIHWLSPKTGSGGWTRRYKPRWLRSLAGKLLHDCDGLRARCGPG